MIAALDGFAFGCVMIGLWCAATGNMWALLWALLAGLALAITWYVDEVLDKEEIT